MKASEEGLKREAGSLLHIHSVIAHFVFFMVEFVPPSLNVEALQGIPIIRDFDSLLAPASFIAGF